MIAEWFLSTEAFVTMFALVAMLRFVGPHVVSQVPGEEEESERVSGENSEVKSNVEAYPLRWNA